MFTVTALTGPRSPTLDAVLVENLRNAWGGGKILWLSMGEAAEFPTDRVPDNFADTWQSMREIGIDIGIQPSNNRKKQMLIADMDRTMIHQECIDELAAEVGVGAQVSKITTRAMNGELDFETALRERVRLLSGTKTALLDKVFNKRITLVPGGRTLVSTMRANGSRTALVSGGFTAFSDKVAHELGFDESRANVLLAKNGRLTGQVAEPILGKNAKVAALREISTKCDISPSQVLAVGDGANDLGMLEVAGIGVGFHAKPAVVSLADVCINYGDLTALLYLQGYRRDEFVH